MKASRKMLGQERASSPLLDLLASGAFKAQPAKLQLSLAGAPVWGQDLLLTLRAQRVQDSAHLRGPLRLEVRLCAQALLHEGSVREPLWKQTVHLDLDSGKGACEVGLRRVLCGGSLGPWAGPGWSS